MHSAWKTLGVAVLAALAPLAASAGEPLLLPDFTPASTSDFGVAIMLHTQTQLALESEGHLVLNTELVRPLVGDATDQCAEMPSCPMGALMSVPSKYAVVVLVGSQPGGLVAEVEIYEETSAVPLEVRSIELAPGSESRLAETVVELFADVVSVAGPTPTQDLVAAAKLLSGEGTAAPEPEPQRPVEPEPVQPAPAPDPEPPPTEAPPPSPVQQVRQDIDPNQPLDYQVAVLLKGTDLPPRYFSGVEKALLASGQDPRDFLFEQRPHGGRWVFEIRGGVGIGDTERRGDVRAFQDNSGRQAWFQEGPFAGGPRVRGSVFLGYAINAWVDVGAVVGLQYGSRSVTTGIITAEAPSGDPQLAEVDAAQLVLQPRARVYLPPTGPVKAYLTAGAEIRYFDPYRLVDPDQIYPQIPGGIVPGPVGGLGLVIDPSPMVGIVLEGTAVYHLGERASAVQFPAASYPNTAPAAPVATAVTFGIVGGVQFRL